MSIQSAVPVIAVSSLEYNKALSDETMNYSAVISVNGIKCIRASNRGYGACDDHEVYHPYGRSPTDAEIRAHNEGKALLAAYAKTLPKRVSFGTELEEDVESVIKDAVCKALARRDFRRELKKRIMLKYNGVLVTLKCLVKDFKAREELHRREFEKIRPGSLYLIDMPEDEAFNFWYEQVTKE